MTRVVAALFVLSILSAGCFGSMEVKDPREKFLPNLGTRWEITQNSGIGVEDFYVYGLESNPGPVSPDKFPREDVNKSAISVFMGMYRAKADHQQTVYGIVFDFADPEHLDSYIQTRGDCEKEINAFAWLTKGNTGVLLIGYSKGQTLAPYVQEDLYRSAAKLNRGELTLVCSNQS